MSLICLRVGHESSIPTGRIESVRMCDRRANGKQLQCRHNSGRRVDFLKKSASTVAVERN